MALVAQKLKARPQDIATLPVDKKAKHLAHYVGMPDVLAARLLVSYHLGHQRPMMAAFLDALDIIDDNGLISDELSGALADDMLSLRHAARPPIRPTTCGWTSRRCCFEDPDTWAGLALLTRESQGPRASRPAGAACARGALGGGGLASLAGACRAVALAKAGTRISS